MKNPFYIDFEQPVESILYILSFWFFFGVALALFA